MYRWSKSDPNGYEVSSKGDKRFSAFYAKVGDGNSIEYHYQVTIKGYNSIKEGKGKPPKNDIDKELQWELYKSLWVIYFNLHPELLKELLMLPDGTTFTDMFATSDINQARAICEILNNNIDHTDDELKQQT
jgi:hypothetical protein